MTAATASSPDVKPPGIPQTWQKSNFEDWVGDDDDAYYYQDNRPRGSKKQRNKKNKAQAQTWDWDDIYDPARPNDYADYKGSEEQTREIRDWKARLYYHQLKGARTSNKDGASHSDEEETRSSRPTNSMCLRRLGCGPANVVSVMFAPPTSLNFAPPSFDDAPPPPPPDDDDDYYPPVSHGRSSSGEHGASTAFAPASAPDDATGQDIYMRRMQMSGMPPAQSQSPPVRSQPSPPPTSVVAKGSDADIAAKRAEAQAKIAAFKAKHLKPSSNNPPLAPPSKPTTVDTAVPPPPPPPDPLPATANTGSTISRAPVRYTNAAPLIDAVDGDTDTPMTEIDGAKASVPEDERRSNRPGQKGFAERLLQKYGWEKGHGLGAQGEGITTALVAKAEKRKKKSDAQGGGWAAPANMGKIVGGKKRKVEDSSTPDASGEDDPRYGKLSEVIKLESMLNGLDVQHEIEENNLMQEIGEHMGKEYGNVERVFIWRESMGGGNEVFVKFTSQLSALNAVNGMGGTEFAGNMVQAKFWDGEMFERGEYA